MEPLLDVAAVGIGLLLIIFGWSLHAVYTTARRNREHKRWLSKARAFAPERTSKQ